MPVAPFQNSPTLTPRRRYILGTTEYDSSIDDGHYWLVFPMQTSISLIICFEFVCIGAGGRVSGSRQGEVPALFGRCSSLEGQALSAPTK